MCGNGKHDEHWKEISGVLELVFNETCDDNNTDDWDGCNHNCSIIELGWSCPTFGEPCEATCGDGKKQEWEKCDNGKNTTGTGCKPGCLEVEDGWTCP